MLCLKEEGGVHLVLVAHHGGRRAVHGVQQVACPRSRSVPVRTQPQQWFSSVTLVVWKPACGPRSSELSMRQQALALLALGCLVRTIG